MMVLDEKDHYYEPNIFYRHEATASGLCRLIGISGIILAISLSNIFFYDMYNTGSGEYASTPTIAKFMGYDWYNFFQPEYYEGSCEYWSLILIQLVNLYNSGALVVATFSKNKWWSLNWFVFGVVLIIGKCISFFFHLKQEEEASCAYVVGSIFYLITMFGCLMIILFTTLSWVRDDDDETPRTPRSVNESMMRKMEMSVFDSPTPYEPNFNYSSF